MKTSHTPGPWNLPSDKNTPRHIIMHESVDGFIPVCYMHLHNDKELTEANARLISAAPDLLEALDTITNIGEHTGREGCTYGDTQYDSLSVSYGYNLALEHLKEIAIKAIKKATK